MPHPPWALFQPFATADEQHALDGFYTMRMTLGRLLAVYGRLVQEADGVAAAAAAR